MKRSTLSAGVVVVHYVDECPRLLLLRAYRNWDFPKGTVEKGESPLQAAQREVREESGLRKLDFRWGMDSCDTQPYGRGKVARYYLAQSRTDRAYLPVNPELGRPEHHEFRWVSPAEARHLLPPRLQPILQWAMAKLGSP